MPSVIAQPGGEATTSTPDTWRAPDQIIERRAIQAYARSMLRLRALKLAVKRYRRSAEAAGTRQGIPGAQSRMLDRTAGTALEVPTPQDKSLLDAENVPGCGCSRAMPDPDWHPPAGAHGGPELVAALLALRARLASLRAAAAWDESRHPRDEAGRWSEVEWSGEDDKGSPFADFPGVEEREPGSIGAGRERQLDRLLRAMDPAEAIKKAPTATLYKWAGRLAHMHKQAMEHPDLADDEHRSQIRRAVNAVRFAMIAREPERQHQLRDDPRHAEKYRAYMGIDEKSPNEAENKQADHGVHQAAQSSLRTPAVRETRDTIRKMDRILEEFHAPDEEEWNNYSLGRTLTDEERDEDRRTAARAASISEQAYKQTPSFWRGMDAEAIVAQAGSGRWGRTDGRRQWTTMQFKGSDHSVSLTADPATARSFGRVAMEIDGDAVRRLGSEGRALSPAAAARAGPVDARPGRETAPVALAGDYHAMFETRLAADVGLDDLPIKAIHLDRSDYDDHDEKTAAALRGVAPIIIYEDDDEGDPEDPDDDGTAFRPSRLDGSQSSSLGGALDGSQSSTSGPENKKAEIAALLDGLAARRPVPPTDPAAMLAQWRPDLDPAEIKAVAAAGPERGDDSGAALNAAARSLLVPAENRDRQRYQISWRDEPSPIVDGARQKPVLYVKTFLINDERNRNGWRASWGSIRRMHKTFRNQPGIEFWACGEKGCLRDHTEDQKSYRANEKHQRKYSVSTIVDTVLDEATHTAYAIHRIDRPDFAEQIRRGVVKYLSPSIWPDREKTEFRLVKDAPDLANEWHIDTTGWRGLHDAWVDVPAYGPQARVIATCEGREDCPALLRRAQGGEQLTASARLRDLLARLHALRGTLVAAAAWDESKHPRGQPGNPGQFAETEGGGGDEKKAAGTIDSAMRWRGKAIGLPGGPSDEDVEAAYPDFGAQELQRVRDEQLYAGLARAVLEGRVPTGYEEEEDIAGELGDMIGPIAADDVAAQARARVLAANRIVERAAERAPSFWRGASAAELDSLLEKDGKGRLAGREYKFVAVSASQAAAANFGTGVVLELDADLIRKAEGKKAFRVRYGPPGGSGSGSLLEGPRTYDRRVYDGDYIRELETRLANGAFGAEIVKRIYVTPPARATRASLEAIAARYSGIAPVVFVPERYHSTNPAEDRHRRIKPTGEFVGDRALFGSLRLRIAALRAAAWDESKHPRNPAGSPEGGEFAEDPHGGAEDEDDSKKKKPADAAWDGKGDPYEGLDVPADRHTADTLPATASKLAFDLFGEDGQPAREAIARASSLETLRDAAAGAILFRQEYRDSGMPDDAWLAAIGTIRDELRRRQKEEKEEEDADAYASKATAIADSYAQARRREKAADAARAADEMDPGDTAAIARRLGWVNISDPDARKALRKLYPMFAEQEAARKKINPIVDRMQALAVDFADAAADTRPGHPYPSTSLPPDPSRDAQLARGAKSAWSKAPSFWRGIGFGALADLTKTGTLRTKKKGPNDPVSVSASQGEAYAFGDGVMVELDAEAVRRAEGSDATRVRYAYENSYNEEVDTACDGCEYNPRFANETETRLRQGAFGRDQIKRIYITLDDDWTDEKIAEVRGRVEKVAPVVFVPRGYHGPTADMRSQA